MFKQKTHTALKGLAVAVVTAVGSLVTPNLTFAQTAPSAVAGTGLPIPRFVSLKADRVNLRKGPGTTYPTAWVFRRAGLPVEVIKEFDAWRQVRDAEGTTGWVIRSLLSGRRTAQVLPWDVKPGNKLPQAALRSRDTERAEAVAMLEAGVVADVHTCDGRWCRVTVDAYSGYIEQTKLWGVYAGETVR